MKALNMPGPVSRYCKPSRKVAAKLDQEALRWEQGWNYRLSLMKEQLPGLQLTDYLKQLKLG